MTTLYSQIYSLYDHPRVYDIRVFLVLSFAEVIELPRRGQKYWHPPRPKLGLEGCQFFCPLRGCIYFRKIVGG